MPFFDRYWWLRLLGALFVLLIFAAYDAPMIVVVPNMGTVGSLVIAGVLLASLAGVSIAMILTVSAARAHDRFLRRRRAISGDLEAIPISRFTANARHVPDLATGPLQLMWRPAALALVKPAFVSGCFLFLLCPMAFAVAYALSNVPGARPVVIGAFGLASLACIGVIFVSTIKPARHLIFGDRFGVTATAEGVVQRTRRGRLRMVRWEDARLLEVVPVQPLASTSASLAGQMPAGGLETPVDDTFARAYVLYGVHGIVRWKVDTPDLTPSNRARSYEPDGIEEEEMRRRQQSLVDLIAARTDLVPRTFARQLRPAPDLTTEQAVRLTERITVRVVEVVTAVAGGICLALAAPIMLLPATTWLLLNMISAVGLAAIGIGLVILALRGKALALDWLQREATAMSETPDLESVRGLSDPTAIYALACGIPRDLWRILTSLALVLLAIALPVALLAVEPALIALPPGALPSAVPRLNGAGGVVLAFVLAPFGISGLALLVGLRRIPQQWTRLEVHADSEAIRMSMGGRCASLPWDAVRSLILVSLDGVPIGYCVMNQERDSVNVAHGTEEAGTVEGAVNEQDEAQKRTRDGNEMVIWPVGFARWQQTVEGTSAISPAQLASLVEQRSGVRLKTENHELGVFAKGKN